MIILSYNLSSTLESSLKKIEKLREKILLIPLSPKNESALSWQTAQQHLSGWSTLSNQPLSKEVLDKVLLSPGTSKGSTSFIQKAIDYRQALNHIWQDWTANPSALTTSDLKRVAGILKVSFRNEDEITSLLGYIQTGNVHPVIQSAIVHLYFYPNRLSYLISLLILYKYGYDLKRFISFEDYWSKDKERYLQVLGQATKQGNITLWLEYYCQAMIEQMEKIVHHISSPTPPFGLPTNYWYITDRQKAILGLIDTPATSLTNKKVQQSFQVSQITASRDLAKLASLNLLIPHGKGRSIYYTKA